MNKTKTDLSLPKKLCRGKRIAAEYHEPEIEPYRNNPLLECLPLSLSKSDLLAALVQSPAYSDAEQKESNEKRLLLMDASLEGFFQPLLRHVRLEQSVSRMIRSGYIGRNPLALDFYMEQRQKEEKVNNNLAHPGTVVHSTPSALLTGLSGSGKSYSLERILKLTPQVIDHTVFKDRSFPHQQLVWLKLDCPSSPRALCTSFFQAVDQLLGTNYLVNYWGNNGTVGTMVPGLVRVALLHSLGMLVLDEAQNLNAGRAGGTEQLLNFIVELENTLGVPVLMVGNASVMDAFARGFRQLRRGTGLQEPHWFRMTEESKDWEFFTTAMWRYQYLRGKTTLTAEFRGELYYQTQGVADFAVKLYKEVQAFLINSGEDEVITPEVIARVAHVVLFRNALVLKALRERDLSIVKNSTDICIQDICGADLPAEELDRLEKNKVSTEKKSKKKRAKETTPEATPVVAQAA